MSPQPISPQPSSLPDPTMGTECTSRAILALPGALHLHAPLRRRVPLHGHREGPRATAGPAPGRQGLEIHALTPSRDAGLEAPAPLLEPRPPGGASHQVAHAAGEGEAAGAL